MNEKKKITMLVAVILIFVFVIFFAVKCSNQQYSITFDSRGGNKIESQEIKRGGTIEEPEEPQREGYEFLGWYVDEEEFDFSKKVNKDMKLVAKWKKIEKVTYTVTFDSNGGSEVASKEVDENGAVEQPSNPTREGYIFQGWTLNGVEYDFASAVTENITLVATWKKRVTTYYRPTTNTQITTTPVVEETTPSVEENENLNNNIGNVEDPNEEPTEEPEIIIYTVTFNPMNGENNTEVQVEEGKLVEQIVNPNKKGYFFKEWTLNGQTYNFNTPVTENITLMATYEKDENTAVVENLEQLKEAIANKVSTIILANDIVNIDETLVFDWMVTLDGNGKQLVFTENVKDGILVTSVGTEITDVTVTMNDTDKNWNGHYAIQVYNGQALLNNVSANGADAALLVNSSQVKVTGTTNISNNQFGGIEVSKGVDAGTSSTLDVEGTLINETEKFGQPTIWIDGDHTNVTVTSSNLTSTTEVKEGQTQYYLDEKNTNTVTVTTEETLTQALAHSAITTIELGANIEMNTTVEVNRTVTINGNNHTLTFAAGVKDGIVISANDTIINDLNIIMNSEEGWQGNYGTQVYLAQNVTLNNYSAQGADAALLVNGGIVNLIGTTTVSNNQFGGIEVSSGSGVETDSVLNVNSSLINETESYGLPTIWVDGPSETEINGMTKIDKDGQAQYYLVEANSVIPEVVE